LKRDEMFQPIPEEASEGADHREHQNDDDGKCQQALPQQGKGKNDLPLPALERSPRLQDGPRGPIRVVLVLRSNRSPSLF